MKVKKARSTLSGMLDVENLFDLSTFVHKALFDGCRYPWEALNQLESYLKNLKLGKIESPVPQGVTLIHPELISIGPGTVLEAGAYIVGPCVIGARCAVRHGAYIRGNALIGDGSVVGHVTEVKSSILIQAQAAHFAYLGDTILGSGVNLGAGVKCANLRLDHQAIVLHVGKEKIETGRRKFGSVIGDGSQIGCNTVLNPGTVLGKGCYVYPGQTVGGVIPSRHSVRPKIDTVISPIPVSLSHATEH